ncbi:Sorting nexin Atg20 [Schizosaccharomyces pombe]
MAQDDSYEEKPEVISSDSGGSGYSTEIQIVGTVTSSDGSYVEYEIVHQKRSVWRRYSDFESLVKLMRRQYPAAIVPPIPGKQSLLSYAKHPRKAKSDAEFLNFRSRMLELFLRQCLLHPCIRSNLIFDKFIHSTVSWHVTLSSLDLPKDSNTDPLRLPPIATEHDPFAHLRSSMPLVMANSLSPPSSRALKPIHSLSNPSTASSLEPSSPLGSEDECHPPTSDMQPTHELNESPSTPTAPDFPHYNSSPSELSPTQRRSSISNGKDAPSPVLKDLTSYTQEVIVCRKFLHHSLSPSIHSTLSSISKMESCLSKLGSAFHSLTALNEIQLANHLQVIANAFEFSGMYAKEFEQEFNSSVYEKMVQSMQLAKCAADALKYKQLKIQQRDFLQDQLIHSNTMSATDSMAAASPTIHPATRLNTIQRAVVSQAKKGYTIFGRLQNVLHDFVEGETSISKESLQQHKNTIENQLAAANWDCQKIDEFMDAELKFYKECQTSQWEEIIKSVHECIYKWAQTNLQRWLRTREELENLSKDI